MTVSKETGREIVKILNSPVLLSNNLDFFFCIILSCKVYDTILNINEKYVYYLN